MKKLFFVIVILFGFSAELLAQFRVPEPTSTTSSSSDQYSESSFMDKLYYGAGFNLGGGSEYFAAGVTPLVGYKVTNYSSFGVQFTYQYVKRQNISLHGLGYAPFVRQHITDRFFAYSEYEKLNIKSSGVTYNFDDSWFVGLGYVSPLSNRTGASIMLLYNVLYKDESTSIYDSPIDIRINFLFNFFD